jgi:hypothetical protein
LAKCQFKEQYKDLEKNLMVDFYCDEAELLASGLCIFHDKYYLEDKAHIDEHSAKIRQKLQHLIKDAVYNKKPLFCIGFHLLDFDISKIGIDKVFTIPVYFSHAIFFGETSFFGAQFKGEASFYSATFYGETGFAEATFNKRTDFDSAVFHKETGFTATHFHGNISFSNTIFKENSIFIFAHLSECYGDTDLDNTAFHGETDFSEATFHGNTDFSSTTFHKKATFNHTTFIKKVYFFQTNFLNLTYFSGKFTTDTDFYKAYFENKEKVVFDIDNMHHVSFINTDIVGIRFSDNAIWGEEAKDRFRILDERRLEDIYKKEIDEEENDEDKNDEEEEDNDKAWRMQVFNLGSIVAEYRNLRENYEYRRRYDEAGQFFIREMELKRKYRDTRRLY